MRFAHIRRQADRGRTLSGGVAMAPPPCQRPGQLKTQEDIPRIELNSVQIICARRFRLASALAKARQGGQFTGTPDPVGQRLLKAISRFGFPALKLQKLP